MMIFTSKCGSLEQWIAVVLLVIVDVSNSGLEVFSSLLISKFSYMPAGLPSFSPISGLHDLGASAKRTEPALARHERRVLVGE